MVRSLRQSRCSSVSLGPHVLLPCNMLPRILGERCLLVRAGKSFLNFPQATQHLAIMALSHSSHSSAIDGSTVTPTHGADIVWVLDLSLSYATARFVDPQHTLWEQDGVSADTTTADSTGALAKFLGDIMALTRDQEPGLLHVDTEPFTFHASLPRLELGNTLLLGVRDEHQVISVEKLPCTFTKVNRDDKRLKW